MIGNAIKATLARYEELQDVIAILGLEELSETDQKQSIASTNSKIPPQPLFAAEEFTGDTGASSPWMKRFVASERY